MTSKIFFPFACSVALAIAFVAASARAAPALTSSPAAIPVPVVATPAPVPDPRVLPPATPANSSAASLVVPATAISATVQTLGIVRLKSGASIQGDILAERPDRVIVDLGFSVVSIPRDEIERIITGASDILSASAALNMASGSNVSAAAHAGDSDASDYDANAVALYRTAPGQAALTVKENVSRVGEAVVQIRTSTGLGSGFIIDPSGYVITNEHVISGEYNISITLFRSGKNELPKVVYSKVRIVALDPRIDIALLKIEDLPADAQLPTVPVGDSNGITDGQAVFAIGSPLGLDRTVSQGIVSSRNRPLSGQLYIQTTTQINPGNSGGPLFDLRGEVIGINNMKPMMTGVEGLNFAIPVSVLKTFLRNRDAYAFDARNPNAGYRYLDPPRILNKTTKTTGTENPALENNLQ